MIYPDLEMEIPNDLGRVHFVGIGGAGMSAIAHMMHANGVQVTGSDRAANYSTDALEALGVRVWIGHDATHVGDVDTLVITGALSPDNPEYRSAVERGIPVLHRSQALAWLARGKSLVAVAGAHGKTTSTGMIVTGLLGLGLDPSFANGSVIASLGVASAHGADDLFVIEADESDKSFLIYDTSVALVTNVDPEHLDFYGSREHFMQAFVDFARNARELLVISADDAGAQEVLAALKEESGTPRVRTFGYAADADVRIVSVDTTGPATLEVELAGEVYRETLRVFGAYNAVNAAGALAVLTGLGLDPATSLRAIAEFEGTQRRFEFHGDPGGVRVYDDYAHHPTEVRALLESARSVAGEGKLIVVHQPHLYSRTRTFFKEFAEAFESGADHTIVLEIDRVREAPDPSTTGAIVTDAFADRARGEYIDDWERATKRVRELAEPGDLVLVVGAGSVYKIVPQLVSALGEDPGDS
ncbi:UDP-N-acetylmuramate--L-alanine ligase [Leucobacter denitrificans]|uniref:UDP-N-acetylmuramate--L-alanine ligase n=1 Tax=Leucobacter denitrificans TaxID=683042 RepID=A0A7G9S646_9MICO|nr:UDP-N-acetylmuramate--L-alanine ligase [Leucobacter denitrificans]QNN63321.1 UDP-N-acetylmuramate--L-alanine ligase [Leucobacter denitrificans]